MHIQKFTLPPHAQALADRLAADPDSFSKREHRILLDEVCELLKQIKNSLFCGNKAVSDAAKAGQIYVDPIIKNLSARFQRLTKNAQETH